MANYKAILAIGQAIVHILDAAAKEEAAKDHPDETIKKATFVLLQADDFVKPNNSDLPETGASVYLYRVGVNANCRNLPRRKDSQGKSFHPSLPLDLYFLITPWAAKPDAQYVVLGWMMRMLEDIHHMPSALLNQNQAGEQTFFPTESVELIFDPLSLADTSILWENLKAPKVLPSVTYVVRGVLIDSAIEIPDSGPIQTREMKYQKMYAELP